MTTDWPKDADIRCAKMRANASVGPPAAKGTTIVTGRVGKFCADAQLRFVIKIQAIIAKSFFIIFCPPTVTERVIRGSGQSIASPQISIVNVRWKLPGAKIPADALKFYPNAAHRRRLGNNGYFNKKKSCLRAGRLQKVTVS